MNIAEYIKAAQESLRELPMVLKAIRIGAILFVGVPLLAFLTGVLGRRLRRRMSEQGAMVLQKSIFYAGLVLALVMVMNELGFELKALLGAAGIAGVVLGIASQSSVANIVGGLFLLSEKPFKVGDFVEVTGIRGVILSVDLLSVKMRTLDNRFVRIPNETMIKSVVTNITHFPIRRFELTVGVAYKEDVGRAVDVLKDVADKNPLCLDEPEPLVQFVNFGDSALEIFFGVWFSSTDYFALRGSIVREIKERFDAEGIEIPFPHRTLYTGEATTPFPIRIVDGQQTNGAADDSEG
jgi:small-conductance mechanosensitive channel